MKRSSRAALALAAAFVALGASLSCEPIIERPLSNAPMNVCENPCAAYESGARVRARCSDGRCEIPGRPEFQYFIVVHVPDTSFFAPGMTFVLPSDVFTKTPDPSNRSRCTPPNCLLLPSLRNVTGAYTVTTAASKAVGYELPDLTAIPVRAAYEPVAPDVIIPDDQDIPGYPPLPLDKTFVSSSIIDIGGVPLARFSRVVPPGYYARVLFPQPPFDQYFPPVFFGSLSTREGNRAQLVSGPREFIDSFQLGAAKTPLDAIDAREVVVTREDGLTGFRVWLADQKTKRRISVIRHLSGKSARVHLYTSGENNPTGTGGGLRENVEAIIAPPESYTAVPSYVTTIFSGGLKNLDYPRIPPPVPVTGVIAEPGVEGATLLGYPATLSWSSQKLATKEGENELLRYSTYVATDDRGRYATLLPPGTYRVTVEPAVGTPFAKMSKVVVVEERPTSFTLRPPPRTIVKGKVVLTDERPMSEAEVIAFPGELTDPDKNPTPRPNRTRTANDGSYSLELDPGPYVVTVIPKAGTGFPWVVSRSDVPAQATELPDIRVPAPQKLSFTLRAPDFGLTGNPIVRAVVRILAKPANASVTAKPVEIGSAMTDPNGLVEILLAQEPR